MNILPVLTERLINRVRTDLMTQGYSLVDTSRFLRQFSKHSWANIRDVNFYIGSITANKWLPWFETYIEWQQKLLHSALNEQIELECSPISIRYWRKSATPHGGDSDIERPHLDEGWIRALVTLQGLPTLLCKGKIRTPTPLQHTLFITGVLRNKAYKSIRATLHCKPHTMNQRKFIVIGWNGQKEPKS